MKYMETHSTDPAYNLAYEQYVLEHYLTGDYLMLWQNENTIVVGRNQNAAEEIDAAYAAEHGIRVVRRMTGGGTVYHDLGNLNYSFITDAGAPETHTIRRFTEPVCKALEKMGVHAETSGRNDILIDGKKVSGIAERIYKNRILHHGCILFRTDTSVLSAALRPDPSKFLSKGVKSVSSRVGNIYDFLPEPMTVREFWDRLKAELLNENFPETDQWNKEFSKNDLPKAASAEIWTNGKQSRLFYDPAEKPAPVEPSPAELEEIAALAESKYRSWDWTWGHSPAYTYSSVGRFPGGTVKLMLNISHGIITDAAFSGDYMALTDCDEAVEALKGCRCTGEEIREALQRLDMEKLFGGITAENILQLTRDLLSEDDADRKNSE